MNWTDEAVESLRRLAQEGRSASGIAAALGLDSRNAVIGKASRLGIKLGGGGASRPRAERGAVIPSSGPIRRRLAPPGTPKSQRPSVWRFAGAEVGEMRRVRFEDIRGPTCLWPLGDPRSGDFAYCGLAPAAGHAYCAGHCRMAYRPPGAGSSRNIGDRTTPSWRLG